jgi:hypothetical protein
MSDADDARASLLKRLDESIETFVRSYRRWQFVQWGFTTIIAAAGALTSAAGIAAPVEASGPPWYGTPTALLAWGVIAAVTASLSQATSPGVRSERNHQTKFALHLTKGALEVGRISAGEDDRLWGMALTDPDKAIEELSSSRTSPESNGPSV